MVGLHPRAVARVLCATLDYTDMIRFLSLPLLLSALFLLSGCGPKLSPLTQRLVEEEQWAEPELQRIQFYLSEDLVLTRELRSGGTTITQGRVKMLDGRQVEELVFRARTPGVYTFSPKTNRIAVSFEGNDNNFLVFGPNPKNGNRYTLMARDWTRRSGTVTYAGREWRVSASDAFTNLLIPIKSTRKRDVNGRVVGGRKL